MTIYSKREATAKKIQIFILMMFFMFIFYLLARTITLYFSSLVLGEKILSFFFLSSELFVIFHAFGYYQTILKLKPTELTLKPKELMDYPPVAILVAARHEPYDVLNNTFICLYNLDYPNKHLYLLDDSSEKKYINEASQITSQYGATIFRRDERHGAKAGIINDCMKNLDEKYIAIFDADQNPIPSFLKKVIAYLENDEKLAFVQTPQFYSNLGENKVAFASNMQQAVFYEHICEGKSNHEAMFCCGTNVVFRKEALLDVGGFDESTVTEDFATSIDIHMKGWRSFYYNHAYTFGMGPTNLVEYFKQQNRWGAGNVKVLKRVLKEFFINPKKLRPILWMEYLITGSYYLISWAYFFLIMCPVIFIFFNYPSFFMKPTIYILTFVPVFILSNSIFYSIMKKRGYGINHLFKGQLLFFITLPVYLKAAFTGLFGGTGKFAVTSKAGDVSVSYLKLWPQLLLWSIHLVAITWGAQRFYYERNMAVVVNMFWISLHFLLLSSVFYFNEEE